MPQYELNFRDYIRIIRRRKFTFLVSSICIFFAVVLFNNLQTPVYEAAASIRISPRTTLASALLEYITAAPGDPLITETKIIKSRPIVEKVVVRLGLADEITSADKFNRTVDNIINSITTFNVQDTNIVNITVRLDNPRFAQEVANTVVDIYIEENLKEKNKQARQVREFVERQLATTEKNLRDSEEKLKTLKLSGTITGVAVPLENNLMDLRSKLSELLAKATERHPHVVRLKEQLSDIEKQLKSMPGGELEYARLTREVGVNEEIYIMLKKKFEEVRISEAEKVEDVSIVNYASEPDTTIKPNKKLGIILGCMLGIGCGFVVSFVSENLDTSLGTIEDVESLLKLPVMGVIPHVHPETLHKSYIVRRFWPVSSHIVDEAEVRLGSHYNPKSPVAEAYRTLRTNIKFSSERKMFLVTSAGPKEGKTTVLINLGLTIAQMGSKILLVSSDLRRPSIYKTFGITREPGLTEVLTGVMPLDRALRNVTDILMGRLGLEGALKSPGLENISILTTGHMPTNPSELLGSKEMVELIKELRLRFDVVLFDSPPLLPITDAAILSPYLDGVLIVYEVGKTARAALLRAKMQLENVGAKPIGIILNHIKPETELDTDYAYYHYRYYGKEEKKKGISEKA